MEVYVQQVLRPVNSSIVVSATIMLLKIISSLYLRLIKTHSEFSIIENYFAELI